MPCGQKKSSSEITHSQTVTPPLAAMEGTTLRLNTATTNRSTRSHRPRTRFRCGAPASMVPGSAILVADVNRQILGRARRRRRALLLRLRQRWGDVRKGRQMLVYVGLGVLHADGPLLIPPVRLRHHSAVDHAEPVMPPQVNINSRPIAVIADLLRIEHQHAIGARLRNVSLQSRLGHRFAISVRQLLAELVHVRVVLPREHLTEGRQPRRHGYRIRVVGSSVKDFVLRYQVHYRRMSAEGRQRESTT